MPKSPGRPKGSKDKVPRTLKAAWQRALDEIVSHHSDEIRAAILEGIRAGPPHSAIYLRLCQDAALRQQASGPNIHAERVQIIYQPLLPPGVEGPGVTEKE